MRGRLVGVSLLILLPMFISPMVSPLKPRFAIKDAEERQRVRASGQSRGRLTRR